MKNAVQRVILFVTAIPILVLIPIFVPYGNQLLLWLLGLVVIALATSEYCDMLVKAGYFDKNEKYWLGTINVILGVLFYLTTFSLFSVNIIIYFFLFASFLLLTKSAFIPVDDEAIKLLLPQAALRIFSLFYIGLLSGYWILVLNLGDDGFLPILFLLYVFVNDSTAYLAGVLFGKTNKNIIFISPNKSVAGFIGGLVGIVILALLLELLFRKFIPFDFLTLIFAGFVIALVANIGDLVESSFKRSCGVKDSGNRILGRGGILDSIDSLLFAAPIFYYFFA